MKRRSDSFIAESLKEKRPFSFPTYMHNFVSFPWPSWFSCRIKHNTLLFKNSSKPDNWAFRAMDMFVFLSIENQSLHDAVIRCISLQWRKRKSCCWAISVSNQTSAFATHIFALKPIFLGISWEHPLFHQESTMVAQVHVPHTCDAANISHSPQNETENTDSLSRSVWQNPRIITPVRVHSTTMCLNLLWQLLCSNKHNKDIPTLKGKIYFSLQCIFDGERPQKMIDGW